MSGSQIISRNNGKIFDELLPNPYPFPAQPPSLAQVLTAGDDAGNGNIENLAILQTTNVVQRDTLGQQFLVIGGTITTPGVGGDLRIQGATAKGSILAGNGTSTVGLPVGANGLVLKANSATATGLEWGADASGGTVEAVNAGTNINVGGTISQPIVNLSAPLTSTLGMGTVALTDKVGASGASGQFLSCGTGGETEWATPPDTLPTITAGNNISVSGTQANPTIALQSPLTTDLFLGSVNMTAGDPTTQTHLISNNGGVSYTSALNVGGQLLATYTASSMSISDPAIQKNISIAPSTGIFINDQSTSTILDTTITETLVQVKSQTLGSLTQASLSQADIIYTNTDNTTTPTFTDGSTYGNCSRTATSLDNTTGTNATRSEIISRIAGSNQILQYNEVPNFLQFTHNTITDAVSGCVYQGTSESLVGAGTQQKGAYGLSATTTQGEVSVLYENNTGSPQYQGTGNIITTSGASSMTLTSSNISVGQSHLLRMECPSSGNALIEHTSVGVVKDLDITTQGRLSMISGQQGFLIQGNPLNITAVAGNVGGQLINTGVNHINRTTGVSNISQPSYLFQNENASNASFPVIQLARPVPASVAGDTLGAISFFADDAGGGVSREWARIQTKAENVSGGNQDSTLSIFTSVNGTMSEVANYNGAQNENNTFRPFDLNNNEIRTASGNIVLSGTLSSGVGSIELKTKDATAGAGTGLILTGNTLLNASAGGSSGQHLALTINGTVYKIALLNP